LRVIPFCRLARFSAAGIPTHLAMPCQPHKNAIDQQLKCTRLCTFHLRGECKYGNQCTFAHTSNQLQRTPDLRKTRLCKAFAAGRCDESVCNFAHGQAELRATGICYKKALCAWHAKGKCINGDRCRFAHGVHELRNVSLGLKEQLAMAEAHANGVDLLPAATDFHNMLGKHLADSIAAVGASMPEVSNGVMTTGAPMKVHPHHDGTAYTQLVTATPMPPPGPAGVGGIPAGPPPAGQLAAIRDIDAMVAQVMVEERKQELMQQVKTLQHQQALGELTDENGLCANLAALTSLLLQVSGQLRNIEQQHKELTTSNVRVQSMRL